eukprot:EG_transcript_6727
MAPIDMKTMLLQSAVMQHSPYPPKGHPVGQEVGAHPELEKLLSAICLLMRSREHNPYKGLVHVMRLRNLLFKRFPDLLWKGFDERALLAVLQARPALFGLLHRRGKWWVHLTEHEAWARAGAREAEGNRCILDALESHLQEQPAGTCTVDHFMASYQRLPARWTYPLPPRGDLVRLIRYDPRFTFDEAAYAVALRRPGSAAAAGHGCPATDGPRP